MKFPKDFPERAGSLAFYTEEQLRYLEEIFTACSRYEASFWDMADRFGTEGGVQA